MVDPERSPAACPESYLEFERRLAAALTAADPLAVLASGPDLPEELASAVGSIDPGGLRIAALLVTKLRFERLMNGSDPARRWFAEDPEAFTEAFRDYHHAVPPQSLHPWGEAADFRRWLAARASE